MQTTDKLMEYIQDSPSPYHAAAAAAARLEAAGFTRLEESAPWAGTARHGGENTPPPTPRAA